MLCCGVLMYVNTSIAEKVARMIFARAVRLVGLICLAPLKGQHGVRASDGVFVHDMDPLIDKAGGKVLSARWIGTTTSGSSPSHVIIAEPRVCPQIKELTTVWDGLNSIARRQSQPVAHFRRK
jgi:hypothetical protein